MSNSAVPLHAFEHLLSGPGADQRKVKSDYDRFRNELVKTFHWFGSRLGTELADETIYRILKNMASGLVIEDLKAYARKVAWNVMMESRRVGRDGELPADVPCWTPLPVLPAVTRLEGRLEQCKAQLTREELELIEAYYLGEKSAKIRNREALSRRFGLKPEALRLRVYRIRRKLRACVGCRNFDSCYE